MKRRKPLYLVLTSVHSAIREGRSVFRWKSSDKTALAEILAEMLAEILGE
jgi:hypothetical protein